MTMGWDPIGNGINIESVVGVEIWNNPHSHGKKFPLMTAAAVWVLIQQFAVCVELCGLVTSTKYS